MCARVELHFTSPSIKFLLLITILFLGLFTQTTDSVALASCCCPEGYIPNGRKNGRGCHYTELISWPHLKLFFILVGIIAFLAPALVNTWVYSNKNRKPEIRAQFFENNGGKFLQKELQRRNRSSERSPQINIYSAEDIKSATSNYSNTIMQESCKGGTVIYRGTTPNDSNGDGNTEVIIMKIEKVPTPKVKNFIKQLLFLAQPHRNLVRLIGCCLETESPFLVYVGDGTRTLSNLKQEVGFSCQMRIKVAVESLRALNHLHCNKISGAKARVHGNVCSSNILLDGSYSAKLFYAFDDQYYSCGPDTRINDKSDDVHGFGRVLKDLLDGHKAFAEYPSFQELSELANRCSSENTKERPATKEVETKLSKLMTVSCSLQKFYHM